MDLEEYKGTTKQTAFRLPQETLKQLDWMVDEGYARNRTEAAILSVDRYYISKNYMKERDTTIAYAVDLMSMENNITIHRDFPEKDIVISKIKESGGLKYEIIASLNSK